MKEQRRSFVNGARRKKQRVANWRKLVRESVKSDVSAEVEGLLVAAVTDVPHLPHHAEIPTDAHHPHHADVLTTAPEKTTITEVEDMDAATTRLPRVVVVDA